jgi:hypothetical protein
MACLIPSPSGRSAFARQSAIDARVDFAGRPRARATWRLLTCHLAKPWMAPSRRSPARPAWRLPAVPGPAPHGAVPRPTPHGAFPPFHGPAQHAAFRLADMPAPLRG